MGGMHGHGHGGRSGGGGGGDRGMQEFFRSPLQTRGGMSDMLGSLSLGSGAPQVIQGQDKFGYVFLFYLECADVIINYHLIIVTIPMVIHHLVSAIRDMVDMEGEVEVDSKTITRTRIDKTLIISNNSNNKTLIIVSINDLV